jgi:hypothetical protein
MSFSMTTINNGLKNLSSYDNVWTSNVSMQYINYSNVQIYSNEIKIYDNDVDLINTYLNDNTLQYINIKFPRQPATSENYTYSDGTSIRITGSRRLDATHTWYRVFDNDLTSGSYGWASPGEYNASTGNIPYTSRTAYAGDWIMIDLGESIVLQNYRIYPRGISNRVPRNLRLYASSDANCWNNINHASLVLIDERTDIPNYTSLFYGEFAITGNTTPYRFYVMVCNRNYGDQYINPIEIEYYGNYPNPNIDYGKDAIILSGANKKVSLPSRDWSSYPNLQVSGSFKGVGLATGDVMFSFESIQLTNTNINLNDIITGTGVKNQQGTQPEYYISLTSDNVVYTMTLTSDILCDILLVGGGGGGGYYMGGGGGGGDVIMKTNFVLTAGTYSMYVGYGGPGALWYNENSYEGISRRDDGINGGTSYITKSDNSIQLYAAGGGGGGGGYNGNVRITPTAGSVSNNNYSSGGGGGGYSTPGSGNGVSGNGATGYLSESALYGWTFPDRNAPGGGGSSGNGTVSNGGIGTISNITGTNIAYGGGGGGGGGSGTDGGGNGGILKTGRGGYNGTINRGGGGGGGNSDGANGDYGTGGSGGSGIIIIKYKNPNIGFRNLKAVMTSANTLSFMFYDTTVYSTTITNDTWTHFVWNLLQKYIVINGNKITYTANTNLLSANYTNTLGATTNTGTLYFSNLKILTYPTIYTLRRDTFYNDTTNMIAWYNFDDNYNNSSSGSYNLTASGNLLLDDTDFKQGTKSVKFDATAYLENTSFTMPNGNFTIAFWAKCPSVPNTNKPLISFWKADDTFNSVNVDNLFRTTPPYARYSADNWDSDQNKLFDTSGSNRDSTAYQGSINKGVASGNGASATISYLRGATTAGIRFPVNTIQATFTICSITRYSGATKTRIIDTVNGNWLHGHWGGLRGVAHYDAWKTQFAVSEIPTSLNPLYTFSSHTFTNATATGRNGPTLAQCRTAYSTATWAQDATNLYLNMTTQGIQLWKVPVTGSYTITCAGARGGTPVSYTTYTGGSGAIMSGTFTLNKGDIVKIAVGQKGVEYLYTGGGGGGTFVTKNDNTPLIVAGGGGGSGTDGGSGKNASTSSSGTVGNNANYAGGTNGNGGQGAGQSGWGLPGAGIIGDGNNSTMVTGDVNAKSFINGAIGGAAGYGTGAPGGFGGGGAGGNNGGSGGGGYSGGGAAGGGGGSFGGTASATYNNGDGYVTITFIYDPVDWLVCCGKNSGSTPNNILMDGVAKGTARDGTGNRQLSINYGGTAERSDWEFSECLIWDSALSDANMLAVSQLLSNHLSTGKNVNEIGVPLFSINQKNDNLVFMKTNREYLTSSGFANNTWKHITVTHDTTVTKLYVNGVESSNVSMLSLNKSAVNRIRIGGNLANNTFIDDIRIYNTTITERQVASLYLNTMYKSKFYDDTADMIAWYNFDDDSTNMLLDSSGNNNTLTNIGTTFDSNNYRTGNGSVAFTGSSYLEIANDGRFSPDSFTITGWGKLPPDSDTVICASCRSGTVQNGYGWTIAIDTVRHNKIRFSTRNVLSVAVVVCYSTTDFCSSPAKWNHFAFSYSSILKKVVIYINGVLDITYDNIEYSANTTTNLRIGAGNNEENPSYSSFYLQNGSLLDDFRIYNRVLTPYEIDTLYSYRFSQTSSQSSPQLVEFGDIFYTDRNNIIAWYKFDTNSTIMLTDSSGNGNNLINTNATFDADNYKTGKGSIYLNGSSQYLDINSAINPYTIWNNNGITFSLWFKMSTNSGQWARILDFSIGTSGNPTTYMLIAKSGTSTNLNIQIVEANVGAGSHTTTGSWIDNTWHYITWSISPSGAWTIYIDGVNLNVSITRTVPNATYSRKYIGRSAFSGDGWYVGNIDDFRIYNKVLTADEISSLYYGGSTKWTDAQLYGQLYAEKPVYNTLTNEASLSTSIANLSQLYYNTSKKLETNAAGVAVNGNVSVSGFISPTPSDIRLKTIIENIDAPLEKIMRISGFKYFPNDLAKSLAYTEDREQVGLSAQDVQAILPEIVELAPLDSVFHDDGTKSSKSGNNYLTICYEYLVPLLIECIKELKKQLELVKRKRSNQN